MKSEPFLNGIDRPVTLLALLLLLAKPSLAPAQFDFITNNGAITITKYSDGGGVVVIPSATNGLPVIRVGEYAFCNVDPVRTVMIPEGVTSIGNDALRSQAGSPKSKTIPSQIALTFLALPYPTAS
jgi:hypothetical protein